MLYMLVLWYYSYFLQSTIIALTIPIVLINSCNAYYIGMLIHYKKKKYIVHDNIKFLTIFIQIGALSLTLWSLGAHYTFKSALFYGYFLIIVSAAYQFSRRLMFFCTALASGCYLYMFLTASQIDMIQIGPINEQFVSQTISVSNPILRIFAMILLTFTLYGVAVGYLRIHTQSEKTARLAEYAKKRTDKSRTILKRRVNKSVAQLIEAQDLSLIADRYDAAVLFCQFSALDTMRERIGIKPLHALINDYFVHMSQIVLKYNGLLDTFNGDTIMASFGTPIKSTNSILSAAGAAYDMHRALRQFSAQRERAKEPILSGHISLHAGPLVAGNVGSVFYTGYTLIGNTIDVAMHMLKIAYTHAVAIIISEAIEEKITPYATARALGQFKIPNMEKAYALCALEQLNVGKIGLVLSENKDAYLD